MKESSNHFNESANQWDSPDKIERAKSMADRIKSYFKHNSPDFKIETVLEIGSGTGLLGGNFIEITTQYLGLDSSSEMLKVLKQKFPQENVKALNIDIEKQDLSDLNFNFILSQFAFHHLVDPASVLAKLKRISAQKFVIIDLDIEDGTFHPDPKEMGVHHFGFSKEDIEGWAKVSQLKLEHYEIADKIKKNGKSYKVFMAIFCSET